MKYRSDLRDALAGASAPAIFRAQVLRLSDLLHVTSSSDATPEAAYGSGAGYASWQNPTKTRPPFVPVLA